MTHDERMARATLLRNRACWRECRMAPMARDGHRLAIRMAIQCIRGFAMQRGGYRLPRWAGGV